MRCRSFSRIASVVVRAALFTLGLAGCDFSMGDIALDRDPERTPSDSSVMEGDAPGVRIAHLPRSADAGSRAPAPSYDVDADPTPAASMHPHQLDGGLTGPLDGSASPTDAGDAQADAGESPPDEGSDAGVDDDDGGSPLPSLCMQASACALATFEIAGDYVHLTQGMIRVSDGTRSIEIQVVDDSKPEIWLPTGSSLAIHTTVAGFWDDEALLVIPAGLTQFNIAAYVFSTSLLETLCTPVGLSLDESKGFAIADFFSNLPGAGVELGAPSDPPIVADPQMLILSNTLVPGGGKLMLFPNVQPGRVTPVPVAPADLRCSLMVEDLEYVAASRTVLRMWTNCEAVGP